MADGVALVAFMDEPKKAPLAFSNKFACPICGYSIAELEPRLFSFNNPQGACPDCDGLGVRMFFDAARVVTHPNLSLAGGAIRGWDQQQHVLLDDDLGAREALQVRHERAVGEAARESPAHDSLRQRRREDPVQVREQEERQQVGVAARVGGHHPEHAAPLHRDAEHGRARGARQVPEHAGVRDVQGHALERGGAQRVRAGAAAERDRELERHFGARVFPRAELGRLARRDRRQDRQGDRESPEVLGRRGLGLFVAGSLGGHVERRRGAAHSARVADRLGARRRHVHLGRAVDRPAPARQPAPARHADEPAQLGQHRARRRARQRSHHGGRLRRRSRARRRRARRPGRRAGHAEGDLRERGVADGPIPLGQARDSAAVRAPRLRPAARVSTW